MAVEHRQVTTARGDVVDVRLFTDAGAPASILVTVTDADACRVPTAELTLREVAEFREVLRELSELGARHRGVRAS